MTLLLGDIILWSFHSIAILERQIQVPVGAQVIVLLCVDYNPAISILQNANSCKVVLLSNKWIIQMNFG